VRITFIINTSSPEALEELRTAVKTLREQGNAVDAHITFEAGDARRMARTAAARGSIIIVGAGGDGTINEIANGIHDHLVAEATDGDAEVSLAPRLGIVPLGTGNDLAAALEIPTDIPGAVEIAVNGTALEVDIGRVNDLCFVNVSSGGFGAEATEETTPEVKRVLGPLAYLITGVRKFATLETSSATFIAAEPIYDGPFLLFAVGNSGRTGGGNWLTPRADMTDGLLDVCIVKDMPRVEFLALLPELRSGNHLDHPEVIYRQVPALSIHSTEELSVNADGEPLHQRAFRYGISPHRLLLVKPR
jgi:diacylglycerol kinase (ATP)